MVIVVLAFGPKTVPTWIGTFEVNGATKAVVLVIRSGSPPLFSRRKCSVANWPSRTRRKFSADAVRAKLEEGEAVANNGIPTLPIDVFRVRREGKSCA